MSSLGKRNSEWVDLTGDDENRPPNAKQARTTINQASSSQPRSGQSLNPRDGWSGANDENEIIDLSQDRDEGSAWTCLGAIDGKIVGIRYYK